MERRAEQWKESLKSLYCTCIIGGVPAVSLIEVARSTTKKLVGSSNIWMDVRGMSREGD